MMRLCRVLAPLLMCAACAFTADAYPQRVARMFSADSPHLPPAVRVLLGAPPKVLVPNEVLARRAGIPFEPGRITAAARASDGSYWLGSDAGAAHCSTDPAVRCEYYAGRRYLPDNNVQAIYPETVRLVWIRTATGMARIEFRLMTLEQKAASFDEMTQARHMRDGFVAGSQLVRAGDLASSRPYPSDNDGLWTAIYLAAESLRYAATRNEAARRQAAASARALLRLEQVTGIPGFPARAVVRRGEYRPAGGEWHTTPDGKFEWKGDTSSDEIVGHFFGYAVYYDLAATDEEKAAIRPAVARIMDHILGHGRNLVGPSGKPTTWGRWPLSYFADRTTLGWCDSPLNALELLSFARTAAHITGKARFEAAYRQLISDGYAGIAAQRLARRCELNYSDEELAMLSFYPLLEYERDGELRATYLAALAQWWENIRREHNPLWNYMYSRATGRRAHLEEAAQALAQYPLDLVHWDVRNSQRADLHVDTDKDRAGETQVLELLPADERPVMRWNANPFVADGGNRGKEEDDGGAYLLAYWFGRYYLYISLE